MSDLKEIFRDFQTLMGKLFKAIPAEQSVSVQNLYEQVWTASLEGEDWMWLIDLYVDEASGSISALFAKEGKLFMSPVSLSDSGATLGEMTQVKEVFEPVVNSIRVRQSVDGTSRWFLISSSTVLNRSGYFNTKELFDKFVEQSESGKNPYATFYHLEEVMKLGSVDWIAREGNLLLMSGLFDDSELGRLMKEAIEKDPDYWGSSISFYPYDHKMVKITESISLPAYTDGELIEVSFLPEKEACALLTSAVAQGRNKLMEERILNALKKLTDGDESLLETLVDKIDSANGVITKEGLLHQSTETTEVTEVTEEAAEESAGSGQVEEIVLDESLIKTVVNQLADHPSMNEFRLLSEQRFQDLQQSIESLTRSLEELRTAFGASTTSVDQRLKRMEKPVAELQQQTQNDLPRNSTQRVVVYRPSLQETGEEEKLNPSDLAEQTLSRIR